MAGTSDAQPGRTVEIAPGVEMPLIGLGTWQSRGQEGHDAVRTALDMGYRHIDTATLYRNEEQVGRALASSGLPRDDVFVTTKLCKDDVGDERAALGRSLDALGTDHVDLWLIHWPPRGGTGLSSWEQLVLLQEEGLARAVGVSNYSLEQIDELGRATGRVPAVNQVEWGPALFDLEVLEGHQRRGVRLEGYSPLRTTDLADPRLRQAATRYGVTPAQVVIRWHVQHGVVVIPKSTRPERIASNADVWGFELSDDEMTKIDGLGR